ncbi:MAG TPA: hypothetical protein VIU61_23595 [Kofleriaceae bacterium]
MSPRALPWLVAAVLCALAGSGHADPVQSRVFTAPTAWLPPPSAIVGSAGLDMRELVGDSRVDDSVIIAYGLGGLAALELGTDSDIRACIDCSERPVSTWFGRAAFRIGARQDAWFTGMPALVLGVRTTYTSRSPFLDARAVEVHVVASRELGPVRVHAGGALHAASHGGETPADTDDREERGRVRPLAGDIAWVPILQQDQIRLEWAASWGVRYQALRWAAIELFVRHREDGALADSTVLMRVQGVFDPKSSANSGTAR